MMLVFPQATQKFNFLYEKIRLSNYGIDVYVDMISRTYNKSHISGILFIVLESFIYKDEIRDVFRNCFETIPINFLVLKKETQGSMCTLLMAINQLKDLSATISSLDQLLLDNPIDINLHNNENFDAIVPTFNSSSKVFSYLLRDEAGKPIQIFEKRVISHQAILGIYSIKNFTDFFNFSIDLLFKYKGFRERTFFFSDVLNSYLGASRSVNFPELITNKYFKFSSISEYEEILSNEKN